MILKKINKNKIYLFCETGLTLVELMATTVILAFVLTSALQLFFYCSALSENSGNMMFSMEEAQSKMEEIRQHAFDDVEADYDNTTFSLSRPSGATGEISVDEVGADVAANLLQITINVKWTNKNKRQNNKYLISMIAKR